ncbi:hypothetical protein ANN_11652 [Periplaneta americana]|uniref:Uncharacterized protein n=1 Tax=Periplaneta americana TaxID=6978 RepID=A0ABQ8T5M2_PERAM|nr:hypothetical protein ANN_11652 [Periplaneta americana]
MGAYFHHVGPTHREAKPRKTWDQMGGLLQEPSWTPVVQNSQEPSRMEIATVCQYRRFVSGMAQALVLLPADPELRLAVMTHVFIRLGERRTLRNRPWVPDFPQYLCQDSILKSTSKGVGIDPALLGYLGGMNLEQGV